MILLPLLDASYSQWGILEMAVAVGLSSTKMILNLSSVLLGCAGHLDSSHVLSSANEARCIDIAIVFPSQIITPN